jgi:murein DD-endopeptidase MepM/ murein hydrolase activator NlpD
MAHRGWTILLVSDEKDTIRQVRISRGRFRAITAAAAFVGAVMLVVAGVVGLGGSAHLKARELARENALLTQELAQMRGQVEGLEGSISRLSQMDNQMRVMAGLDPIDSDVLQVGIGGPGTLSPEDQPLWSVDPDLSKEAFAVSYDLKALERRISLLSESFSETSDSLEAHRDLMLATPSILPTTGWLSSRYSRSRMHPILHQERPHEGIDVSAPLGTPIMAAAAGTVRFAGRQGQLGMTVEIDHGYGYVTRYGHASKLLVRNGQKVSRGDVIAQVGKSGLATSSHLHYEVVVEGTPVNPMNFVLDGPLP